MTQQFGNEVVCVFEKELWTELHGSHGLAMDGVLTHILNGTCSHCAAELDQSWDWYQSSGPDQAVFPKGLPSDISSKEEFLSALFLTNRRTDELDESRQITILRKLHTPEGFLLLNRILNVQTSLLTQSYRESSPTFLLERTRELLRNTYRRLHELLGEGEFEQYFNNRILEEILEVWEQVLGPKDPQT